MGMAIYEVDMRAGETLEFNIESPWVGGVAFAVHPNLDLLDDDGGDAESQEYVVGTSSGSELEDGNLAAIRAAEANLEHARAAFERARRRSVATRREAEAEMDRAQAALKQAQAVASDHSDDDDAFVL